MPDIFVQSFTHLTDHRNADRALHMLQRVASLVKPIMRKRNWILPVLAEFFPDNPDLLGLNINMGQKILVRLRPAHSPDTFLPEADVVGTMLHELTHNVHGPHDEKFYKYLSSLQEEYDALQRSGYAGEGFFSEGRRLGASISHNIPIHAARQKALVAAEKRMKTARVLGAGGKLGGEGRTVGLSPRELAVRAAEQRNRDEKSCASGTEAIQEAEKAAKESKSVKNNNLTSDDNVLHSHKGSSSNSDGVIVKEVQIKSAVKSENAAVVPSSRTTVPVEHKTTTKHISKAKNISHSTTIGSNTLLQQQSTSAMKRKLIVPPITKTDVEWSCPACTLVNFPTALQCDACTTPRPLHDDEWSCLTCGEHGNPHDHWTCKFCGSVKLRS